jgi:hypothetical protein
MQHRWQSMREHHYLHISAVITPIAMLHHTFCKHGLSIMQSMREYHCLHLPAVITLIAQAMLHRTTCTRINADDSPECQKRDAASP